MINWLKNKYYWFKIHDILKRFLINRKELKILFLDILRVEILGYVS